MQPADSTTKSHKVRRLLLPSLIALAVLVAMLLILNLQRDSDTGGKPRGGGDSGDSASATRPGDGSGDASNADARADGAELLAPGALRYHGLVLHATTLEPLEGVQVELAQVSDLALGFGRQVRASTESKPDGTYSFAALPSKTRQAMLYFSKRGFVTHKEYQGNGCATELLPTVALSPGIEITGVVVTEDGSPCSAGEVAGIDELWLMDTSAGSSTFPGAPSTTLGTQKWHQSAIASIDGQGQFTVTLRSGLAAIQARVPGFAPAFSEPIDLGTASERRVRIVVHAGKTLRGRVRNEQGEPVGEARVRVVPIIADREPDRNFYSYMGLAEVRSQADGSFEVQGLTDEIGPIMVEHERYLKFEDYDSPRQPWPDPLEITLGAGQWLTGKLLLADGRPAPPGAGNVMLAREQIRGLMVESDGSFQSETFSLEYSHADLRCGGVVPKTVSWKASAGEHALGVLSMDTGKSIDVRVTSGEGEAIANASVGWELDSKYASRSAFSVSYSAATTDADGSVKLTGLIAGRYRLYASALGYSAGLVEAEIPGDVEVASAKLTLLRAARLRCTVQDANGSAIPGAAAKVVYSENLNEAARLIDPWSMQWIADGAGRVTAENVSTEKPLKLGIRARNHPPLEIDIAPLAAGEDRDLGVIALPEGRSIEGRVVDGAGRGIATASVAVESYSTDADSSWLDRWSDADYGPLLSQCDASGNFAFAGLPPGEHTIMAQADGYWPGKNASCSTSDQNVSGLEVVLREGGVFAGVVVHGDGSPASGVSVALHAMQGSAFLRCVTEAEGNFVLRGTPDGAVALVAGYRIQGGALWVSKTIKADSAGELPHRIELPLSTRFQFRVSVQGGAPLPRAVRVHIARAPGADGTVEIGGSTELEARLENGVGSVQELPSGSYYGALSATGFLPTEIKAIELQGAASPMIEFILDGSRGSVTIRCQSKEGTAVVGATVSVLSGNRTSGEYDANLDALSWLGSSEPRCSSSFGYTNETGIFVTEAIGSDPVMVTVTAPNFARYERANLVRESIGEELLVTLEHGATLVVTVVDAEGNPADGRTLEIWRTLPGDTSAGATVSHDRVRRRTNSKGVNRTPELSPGDYELSLWHENLHLLDMPGITLAAGEERELRLQEPPPVLVQGAVSQLGRPATGGSLAFQLGGFPEIAAAVREDGSFEAKLANEGTYAVHYRSESNLHLGTAYADVRSGAYLQLAYDTVYLRGLVLLADGAPARQLSGMVGGPSIGNFTTDDEGRFELAELSPGTYTWNFDHPPAGSLAPAARFELSADLEVEYQFESTRDLNVVFVGANIPATAWLFAIDAGGSSTPVKITGGSIRSPEGVRADWPSGCARGYAQGENLLCGYFALGEEALREGGGRVEVNLQTGGTVQFRFLDAGGHPLVNRRFEITSTSADEVRVARAEVCGKQGTHHLLLPAGAYRLDITFASGSTRQFDFTVAAGASGQLEIRE